jgi:hypothetical protein
MTSIEDHLQQVERQLRLLALEKSTHLAALRCLDAVAVLRGDLAALRGAPTEPGKRGRRTKN